MNKTAKTDKPFVLVRMLGSFRYESDKVADHNELQTLIDSYVSEGYALGFDLNIYRGLEDITDEFV